MTEQQHVTFMLLTIAYTVASQIGFILQSPPVKCYNCLEYVYTPL